MCLFAFALVPESDVTRKMYPFSDQLVTMQVYLDYLCRALAYLILFYILSAYLPGMTGTLQIFFWLWLGYFIDLILNYNEPFAHLGKIPVSYSLIAGLTMLTITLKEILNDSSS